MKLPKLSENERALIREGDTPHTELRKRLAQQHPVHDEIAKAYQNLGGTTGLTNWAEKNQTDFYKMFSQTAPKPQHHRHEGELKIALSLQRNPHLDGDPIEAEYEEEKPDAL